MNISIKTKYYWKLSIPILRDFTFITFASCGAFNPNCFKDSALCRILVRFYIELTRLPCLQTLRQIESRVVVNLLTIVRVFESDFPNVQRLRKRRG